MQRREFLKSAAVSAAAGAMSSVLGARAPAAMASTTPIIDAHMHVWITDAQRYPYAHPYAKDFAGMPCEATVEMLVEDMDRHGCTHCVLVQTICHGWDNRYLVDCVKRFPQRFKGHGLIDPADPRVADKLEYWTKEHGLVGMRFSPIYYLDGSHGGDGWLDAEHSHALWRKAEQLGSVFNFYIAPVQLPRLATMAKAHPQVKVIVDHLAQVDLSAADAEPEMRLLLAMAEHPNVWVKVSELSSVAKTEQYPFRGAYPYVKRVYEAFGPDRLLFGTGYPGAARAAFKRPSCDKEMALVNEELPLGREEDRAKILGGNAAKLWGFDLN
jgi:predicted TIM-barrel fold metal-dependent hydrolase